MDWLIAIAGILLLGSRLAHRWIPPNYWYLSHRKRRAMTLALKTFEEVESDSKVNWTGSWVERIDAEKCFVFVEHVSALYPPAHSGYVVWHNREEVGSLGGWQFHWGIKPRHAIEEYEKSQEPEERKVS